MAKAKNSFGSFGDLLREVRRASDRRITQQALADAVGVTRERIVRIEAGDAPPLGQPELDRLNRAIPDLTAEELEALQTASHGTPVAAIDKVGQVLDQLRRTRRDILPDAPRISRTRSSGRDAEPSAGARELQQTRPPSVLFQGATPIVTKATAILKEAIPGEAQDLLNPRLVDREPDVLLSYFGPNVVALASPPERDRLRNEISSALERQMSVAHILATPQPSEWDAFIDLVPLMVRYLGRGNYSVYVVDQLRQDIGYGFLVAGTQAILTIHGTPGTEPIGVVLDNSEDAASLRDLVRPLWQNTDSVVKIVGIRDTSDPDNPSIGESVFSDELTKSESIAGPRRLLKNGVSVLHVPAHIRHGAWKNREGIDSRRGRNWTNLEDRQAAFRKQVIDFEFKDACPESSLRAFIHEGRIPPDDVPPAANVTATAKEIREVVNGLVRTLRDTNIRNFQLGLMDDQLTRSTTIEDGVFFEVKGSQVLAHVFTDSDYTRRLDVCIDSAPVAAAFAAFFDRNVWDKITPQMRDRRQVASWLEREMRNADRARIGPWTENEAE